MANNESGYPIEVCIEKVKNELVSVSNAIANKYSLPSSLMAMILEQVVSDIKINTFSTIIAHIPIETDSDTKPADTKPADTKPADVKPINTNNQNAKPTKN